MEQGDAIFRSKTSLRTWRRLAKISEVRLAIILLSAGIYLGSSRDFRIFLVSIPFLAILSLSAFVAVFRAAAIKSKPLNQLLACALICLTPLAYLYSYGPVQNIRFLFWAPAHYRLLAEASKKNGIVMGWDSWGLAGQDTFSYLVVDTQDRLGSTARVNQWTKQVGQSCSLWEKRRVWPKFYIVTTYTNCPYDGVEPAD